MGNSFLVLACSGPEAGVSIYAAILTGYLSAAGGVVTVLALGIDAWRCRRVRVPLQLACLLILIHPAWTISAIQGDCGGQKKVASWICTVAFVGLAAIQYLISRKGQTEQSLAAESR
jgi:hypothetical protein